nr:hypothetical protein Hi04_10k_c4997_00015 [uncultured bacterium]
MNRDTWRTDADGHLSAEGPRLRLTVRHAGSWVGYVILQRAGFGGGSSSEIMLSSGIAPDTAAAIAAVEKVAARVDGMLAERSRFSQDNR